MTLDLWHKCLGHVNAEAIQHVVRTMWGVQLEGPTTTLSMCETCYLTEANCQISCFPIEHSTELFEWVHFDIIFIKPTSYDGFDSLLHLQEEASCMEFVYP